MTHLPLIFSGLLLLSLFLATSQLRAQGSDSPHGYTSHRDIEYASVGGISLKLDLYLPDTTGKPFPVVMWVHGGGWQAGDKSYPMILPLVKEGFAIASIDYRLSQQALFPAQIHDCKAAVRWLRANAARYGLNPDKIGAAGASAGGHLVALLGTTANHPELEGTEGNAGVSSAVQAVVDYFGPADFINWNKNNPNPAAQESADDPIARLIGGTVLANLDKARAASPITYVSSQSCPFFIAHGDRDSLVPLGQSIELNDALQKAGVPSTLYVVKGGGHGFNNMPALLGAFAFLKQYLQTP
jgi:acetyl esterase/lipase